MPDSDLTPINFPFGPVDERTDSKVLPIPRLSSVKNFTRTRNGALQKRPGTTALSMESFSSGDQEIEPMWVASDGTELLAFTDQNGNFGETYSCIPSMDSLRVKDHASKFVLTGRRPVSSEPQNDRHSPSAARNGTLTVYSWVQRDTVASVYACLVDETTDTFVIPPVRLSNAVDVAKEPRTISVGDLLMVFYVEGTNIRCNHFDTDGVNTTFSVAATVASSLSVTNPYPYDVCPVVGDDRYVLAGIFSAGNAVSIGVNDTAHASVYFLSEDLTPQVAYSVGVDTTSSYIFLAYTTDDPVVAVVSFNTSLVSQASDDTACDASATEVGVCGVGSTGAVVTWSAAMNEANAERFNGTAYDDTESWSHFMFASKPFRMFSELYVFGYTLDTASVQNNLYLIQLTNSTDAGGNFIYHNLLAHCRFAVGIGSQPNIVSQRNGYAAPIIDDDDVIFPAMTVQSVIGPSSALFPSLIRVHTEITSYKFSSSAGHRYCDVQSGLHWCFGSGQVYQYDGQCFSELGFSHFPTATAANGTNGSMANGVYQYRVLWEWVDHRGNRHQSAPSPAISHTLAGANDEVILTITGKPFTRKFGDGTVGSQQDVVAAVYRTTAGGAIFYRLDGGTATAFSSAGLGSAAAVTYHDVASDAGCLLTTREQLYTNSGAVPNAQPPASRFICTWQNRLWGISDEYPTDIWWTNEQQFKEGLAWSFPFVLSIPDGGPCVALAAQDVLIILKRDSIMSIQGYGPDRQNVGSFYPPKTLTRGIGCKDRRSVVTDQNGTVYFQSDRGIERLPTGSSAPELVSDPIYLTLQRYTTILQAKAFPERSEVRWIAADAEETTVFLCFNYRTEEWMIESVQNNSGAESMCRWQGKLTHTEETTLVRQSDDGYDDEDYGEFIEAYAKTGDVRFDIVGRVQIPEVYVLGEYIGDCAVTLKASTDGGLSWVDTDTKQVTSGSYSPGQPVQLLFQMRESATPSTGSVRYWVNVEASATPVVDSGGVILNGLTLMTRNLGKGPLIGQAARG